MAYPSSNTVIKLGVFKTCELPIIISKTDYANMLKSEPKNLKVRKLHILKILLFLTLYIYIIYIYINELLST